MGNNGQRWIRRSNLEDFEFHGKGRKEMNYELGLKQDDRGERSAFKL
jgi:hypothetical protein